MKDSRFSPYEGHEDYIFVSYAHKNAEEVTRLLNRMNQEGFRIWYDDGIAPGSEWPEYIAHHLNDAAVCMALVSPDSIASANCRREITYALSKQKPFLGVFLQKTELSPGMELQLSAQQCILRYNYRTEEEFYDKLIHAELLSSCRNIVVGPAEPVSAEDTKADVGHVPVISDEDMAVVEQMHTAKEPSPSETAQRKQKPKKEKKEKPAAEKTSSQKKRPRWLLPSVAGGVLLLIALLVLVSNLKKVTIGDRTYTGKETFVLLRDQEITSDTVKKLGKLKSLTNLSFTNCNFTETLSSYSRLADIGSLSFDHCTGIDDYRFLSDMQSLKSLAVTDSGLADQMGSLASLTGLQEVSVPDNAGFTDLSLLPVGRLSTLNISRTGVTDLAALSEASDALLHFYASGCEISSADILIPLKNLKSLDLSYTGVDGFSAPLNALSISTLNLAGTAFTDMSAFDSLTVLSSLNISDTGVKEASCIRKSKDTLKDFSAANCSLSPSVLEDLSACTGLKTLNISGVACPQGLSFAANMPDLTTLRAENCGLESLTGLADKPKLEMLLVKDNRIQDISALNQLSADSYLTVDLRNNRLTSASTLPAGRYLFLGLNENPALDLTTIPTGESYQYTAVVLEYQGDFLSTEIGKKGASLYWFLIDVPADQQLKVQDTLSKSSVMLVTDDAVAEAVQTYGYRCFDWKIP